MREQEKYAKNKTLRGNKNIAEFQQSYEFACLGRVYWYWCWVRICEYSIWGTLYTYINKAYMSACYLSALKTVFEMLSDFYDRSVSNVYGERTRPTLLHRCDFNLFHHFGSAKRYKYLLRMLACEYRTAIAFAWWLCCTLIYTARWSFAFQQTPCLSYNVSGTQKYKDMSRLFAPHPNTVVKASKSGFRQKKREPQKHESISTITLARVVVWRDQVSHGGAAAATHERSTPRLIQIKRVIFERYERCEWLQNARATISVCWCSTKTTNVCGCAPKQPECQSHSSENFSIYIYISVD